MKNKRVFISGLGGQDGSYLADMLLLLGADVYGLVRRCSTTNLQRVQHLLKDIHVVYGDLTDPASLDHAMRDIQPDLIFNLGAMSFVGESWRQPINTHNVIAGGTLHMLEAMRKYAPGARFYQASSSEMFGASPGPQNESTPFYPRSPYGVAKLAAHWYGLNYKESHGLFISQGILFNHESERRGHEFVTRKISCAVARIKQGKQSKLLLGNLDAKRDWGHARDYMQAAMLIVAAERPDAYVVGTGESHTVREFVDAAFSYVGLNWRDYVEIDPQFMRPAEVNHLEADSTKIRAELGWKPFTSFQQLVQEMVEHDLTVDE